MGMNTIRLEGRLDREEFYEKTDRLGILVMPGWCCCDAWERWKDWHADQKEIAAASLKSQIRILRQHPSVFVWLNGSDGPPPAEIESMYLGILKDLDWPNPSVSSASETATTVTGKIRREDDRPLRIRPARTTGSPTRIAGGAYGFNTETSPGPAIPTRESLERFIPKDHLWPIDDVWNFHAGSGTLHHHQRLHRRPQSPLRSRQCHSKISSAKPKPDLRRRARHVRGLRQKQVHQPPASSSGC